MVVWRKRENLFCPKQKKVWPRWRKNRSISIPKVICRNSCKAFRRVAPFTKSCRKPDPSTTNGLWSRRFGKESFSEKVAAEVKNKRRRRQPKKRCSRSAG